VKAVKALALKELCKNRKVMIKLETKRETDVFRSSDSQLSEESIESVLRVTA